MALEIFRRNRVERITDPAQVLPLYLKWLKKHLARGGGITGFPDRPFASAGFEYQRGGKVVINSDRDSRKLLLGRGTEVERTDPNHRYFGGWSHATVLTVAGTKALTGAPIEIYNDPEFEALMTPELREQRSTELWLDRVAAAGEIPELNEPATWERREYGGGPDVQTTKAFTAAFGTPDNPTSPPANSTAPGNATPSDRAARSASAPDRAKGQER
ncbi:hypothetical protein BWI15_04680 [Kribbella sp. ALI-6-A]|uniref:hypothetical protein n=1 Tax=Kribbella sp. ALI-6-A TaxID=1933817 RepID=UPI00097C3181|nr:hypothetical protein [Kribbella sp. ALI-6-A]ONI76598.1 hypothetical protein BWI15_04680 [Kribbella sp. ALI-6-A]